MAKKNTKKNMPRERTHNVNVVEIPDMTQPHHMYVTSFKDTKKGNIEAEKLMFQISKENGYEGDDFDEFMEEFGDTFEYADTLILITHS